MFQKVYLFSVIKTQPDKLIKERKAHPIIYQASFSQNVHVYVRVQIPG